MRHGFATLLEGVGLADVDRAEGNLKGVTTLTALPAYFVLPRGMALSPENGGDIPVAVNDSRSAAEDTIQNANAAITVLSNDSDPAHATLTVTVTGVMNALSVAGTIGSPLVGQYRTLTLNADGTFIYALPSSPALSAATPGSHPVETFTYTVTNTFGNSATATLSFTIARIPIAIQDTHTTVAGATDTVDAANGVLANDTDPDGDPLRVGLVTDSDTGQFGRPGQTVAGKYGHLTMNADGSYVYVADNTSSLNGQPPGSFFIESFEYAVAGTGLASEALLFISIDRPQNAGNDTASVRATDVLHVTNPASGLLANDIDPDTGTKGTGTIAAVNGNSALVGQQVTLADGALLTVNADGTYTFDPNGKFDTLAAAGFGASNISANEIFTYTLSDGKSATVTITVTGVDNPNTIYRGGAGNDTITGGLGSFFDLSQGGNDTVTGGGGDDGFYFGATLTAADHVNGGGGGNNQIGLEGDYSGGVTLGSNISNIQVVAVRPGFDYAITTDDALVPAGQTMTFWSVTMAANNHVAIDGGAETNGQFQFFLGQGNDTATGGNGNDLFCGEGGADTLQGNGGVDTFAYLNPSDSTGAAHDTLVFFDASNDRIDLPVSVTAIGAPVTGAINSASFDNDLSALLDASHLAAHNAVLVDTTSGSPHTFLVVDANGVAGYQSGADYVFDVTGMTGTLSISTFV